MSTPWLNLRIIILMQTWILCKHESFIINSIANRLSKYVNRIIASIISFNHTWQLLLASQFVTERILEMHIFCVSVVCQSNFPSMPLHKKRGKIPYILLIDHTWENIKFKTFIIIIFLSSNDMNKIRINSHSCSWEKTSWWWDWKLCSDSFWLLEQSQQAVQ